MNMRRSFIFRAFLLFIIIYITIYANVITAKKALVVVPIADLVGRPMSGPNILVSYDNIPLAAGKFKIGQMCPRLHQLIFNEIIDIADEQSNEVRVNIPNVYYLIQMSSQPQIAYWMQKKNLIPLDQLEQKGLDVSKIPKPIEFSNNGLALTQNNTITLLFPWVNSLAKQAYSVGTRFVLTPDQNNKNHYSVYLFDPASMNFNHVEIPKQLCIENDRPHNNADRISLFLKLLRKWAHPDNGFIPYVWGGCSFINVCKKDSFEKIDLDDKVPGIYYYSRADIHSNPKAGFDCSGLVARAAQACGIPYFFKNTTTLSSKLSALKQGETLHEGDLIWTPGHVMVVGSIPNNTLIEARGYPTGYGKVHEVPISEKLLGIKTYDNLLKTYFVGKPLSLLNGEGEKSSTTSDYKILKFASIWNQK